MNGFGRWFILVGWAISCAHWCQAQSLENPLPILSALDPGRAGIDFVHTNGENGRHYVIEPYSAGLAIFDYDNDGWEDIYFVNGSKLPGTPEEAALPTNRLYRNLGDWKFEDVTSEAGVGDAGYGLGCVAGDTDNDGDLDLYVSNYGDNVFYRNNGDGTFTDATNETALSGGARFSAGVVFFDIDNDGDLDLYCGNYQVFQFDQHIEREIGGFLFHPGPADYPPAEDQLFENLGDGRFSDISQASGIASQAGTSMGAIAADFDGDGDCDLFVGNDSQPNFYFVNDGDGQFSEDAIFSGLAYDRTGNSNGNMGVECRDFDHDGWLDLVSTTYQDELPVFYKNQGDGFFDDATNLVNVDRSLHPHVNWGVGLEDFDKDTRPDLFIACGHFMDNIHTISDATQVKVRDYLQLAVGAGRLGNSSSHAVGMGQPSSARGAAFGDLDRDGDQDVVTLNANAPPTLLRNETKGGHWISVRLVGETSNRDAAGALVQCQNGEDTQLAAVHLGRGYQSHYGQRIFFGLGNKESANSQIVTLKIKWPSGKLTDHPIANTNREVICFESGDCRDESL